MVTCVWLGGLLSSLVDSSTCWALRAALASLRMWAMRSSVTALSSFFVATDVLASLPANKAAKKIHTFIYKYLSTSPGGGRTRWDHHTGSTHNQTEFERTTPRRLAPRLSHAPLSNSVHPTGQRQSSQRRPQTARVPHGELTEWHAVLTVLLVVVPTALTPLRRPLPHRALRTEAES